jgi:hypothetical protein
MGGSFIHKLWVTIVVSAFLLLVLFISIFFMDKAMNNNVNAMNKKIIAEVCDNHYSEVNYEFNKSIDISALVLKFLKKNFIDELNSNSSMIFELDNKLNEIWLIDSVSNSGYIWKKDTTLRYNTNFEVERAINSGKQFNVIDISGNLTWTIIYRVKKGVINII